MDVLRSALRILLTVVVIVVGVVVAISVVTVRLTDQDAPPIPGHYELLPAPWLMPKQAGGSALRLAMIHDVLHERFYLHGEAWFHHRHAQVERELATYEDCTKTKDERYFALLDDLAVDMDRLGKPAEGIPILRRKLDLQQPLDAEGKRPAPKREYYTTYANLGTLLAHQHLKGALAKDPTALAGLREGVAFIEQSVAVNPDAHFGRERWQVVTLKYLLHASEHPECLTDYDVAGNSWKEAGLRLESRTGFPRALLKQFQDEAFARPLVYGPRSSADTKTVERIRDSIPMLASSSSQWNEICGKGLDDLIPFDEPALAMVGIWTLGSGANPHFAVVFAHLMEGLQQRSIAWSAYERASELAGKFWADPAIQQRLIAHCRERQTYLEQRLHQSSEALREQHRTELAFGRAEQKAYQQYEAEQVAVGRNPATADFYADFFRSRAPIASDPEDADTIVRKLPLGWLDVILVFQALLCSALSVVLWNNLRARRKELAP